MEPDGAGASSSVLQSLVLRWFLVLRTLVGSHSYYVTSKASEKAALVPKSVVSASLLHCYHSTGWTLTVCGAHGLCGTASSNPPSVQHLQTVQPATQAVNCSFCSLAKLGWLCCYLLMCFICSQQFYRVSRRFLLREGPGCW